MAAGLDIERLRQAFPSRPDLIEGIHEAADSPSRVALFNSISSYVCEQLATSDEPAVKRRKVDSSDDLEHKQANGSQQQNGQQKQQQQQQQQQQLLPDAATAAAEETLLLEIKDISLSLPQRKKFDLCFTQTYLYARAPNTTKPVPGIVYAWRDIEYAFHVPVPDKTQVQFNYILFPRGVAFASLTKSSAPTTTNTPTEPLIFTVPNTAPKPGSIGGASAQLAASVSDSYSALLHWAIEGELQTSGSPAGQNGIVSTDPKVFRSAMRQAHRPQEPAVHVRAFRGSKEGYLFFLPNGILWGFKKPLLFLPLDRITAVSYTSVLQRTFNMVVEVDVGGGGGGGGGAGNEEDIEVEFGMLDQEDYGGIDETYVRRHGLQDRSMAEQRKAKRELAENARDIKGEKDGDGDDNIANGDGEQHQEGEDGEDDGLTELQRAEKQLQDEEDEMEEDYDPGSDGDSDGSGSSDEEDEEEDGEGGGDEGEEDDEEEGDEDEDHEKMQH